MALVLYFNIEKADIGKSVGDFLKEQEISRKAIVAIKHQGGKIEIDSVERRTSFIFDKIGVLKLTFPIEDISSNLSPNEIPLSIVYEDEYILVIDKQAGLPVMPSGKHDVGLANGILFYYNQIGLSSTVHFVNRLDKDTSGLMIIAKYKHIHYLMSDKLDSVSRKYFAVVEGMIESKGTVDAPIYRPDEISIMRVVDVRGKNAVTHYQRLFYDKALDLSLIECKLETGRTHQIRVHMNYIGHPIINDPLYGNGKIDSQQLLHSYQLSFHHPISGVQIDLETGLPERFQEIIGGVYK